MPRTTYGVARKSTKDVKMLASLITSGSLYNSSGHKAERTGAPLRHLYFSRVEFRQVNLELRHFRPEHVSKAWAVKSRSTLKFISVTRAPRSVPASRPPVSLRSRSVVFCNACSLNLMRLLANALMYGNGISIARKTIITEYTEYLFSIYFVRTTVSSSQHNFVRAVT